ncbi:MAG: DUF2330 domain-containing protein [Candidatus Methanofastidiosia archaeon]|jgi:hypothetical protein
MKYAYVIVLLLSGLVLTPVLANRGSMVAGPDNIQVHESQQKAIIAWNGTEEILILSTDMKSSQSAQVLEVIPLPSVPIVDKGDTHSFDKMATLLQSHRGKSDHYTGVEIEFHQKIGAHDITGVEAHDADTFVEWVDDYTKKHDIPRVEIPKNFKDAVSHYIDRDITFFVFDLIETDESVKSVDPLVYQFKTDYLYYPLEITAVSHVGHSESQITLFLVTPQKINFDQNQYPGMVFAEPQKIPLHALREVHTGFTELFSGACFVTTVQYSGPLDALTTDLVHPQPVLPDLGRSATSALPLLTENGQMTLTSVLWVVIIFLIIIACNRSRL